MRPKPTTARDISSTSSSHSLKSPYQRISKKLYITFFITDNCKITLKDSFCRPAVCQIKIFPPTGPFILNPQTCKFFLPTFVRLGFSYLIMYEITWNPLVTLQAPDWFLLKGTKYLSHLLIFFSCFLSRFKGYFSGCLSKLPVFLFLFLSSLRGFSPGHHLSSRFSSPVFFSRLDGFLAQGFVS